MSKQAKITLATAAFAAVAFLPLNGALAAGGAEQRQLALIVYDPAVLEQGPGRAGAHRTSIGTRLRAPVLSPTSDVRCGDGKPQAGVPAPTLRSSAFAARWSGHAGYFSRDALGGGLEPAVMSRMVCS